LKTLERERKIILDPWSNEYLIYVKLINSKRRNWEREANWLEHLSGMQYIWIQVMVGKKPSTFWFLKHRKEAQMLVFTYSK